MRRTRPSTKRAGYTLLEVILAMGIASFLMLAIYSAIGMYYQQLETGREIAHEAQLVRAIVQRIRADLRCAFTDWKPPQGGGGTSTGGDSSAQAGGSGGSGSGSSSPGGTPSTGGSSGQGSTATGGSSSTGSSSSSSSSDTSTNSFPVGGVTGVGDSIEIVVQVAPADLDYTLTSGSSSPGVPMGDVRVIRYGLGDAATGDSNAPPGLIREMVAQVPDDSISADPGAMTRMELLAEEVTAFQVKYFDGSTWLDSWDLTQTSPPVALEVLLGIEMNPRFAIGEGVSRVKNYRVVIALNPAATGAAPMDAAGGGG